MIELNEIIGASQHTQECVEKCLAEFPGHLYGAEFGVAFGGGIEKIGQKWKGRGTVYGFDTFAGHPKGEVKGPDDAQVCMDFWYDRGGEFSVSNTYLDHIQSQLDEKGLDNVVLCPGVINALKSLWFVPKLHYVLLDLDFPVSMADAYRMVKNKIVPGGYLCLHDVIPNGHLTGLHHEYLEIKREGLFEVVAEHEICYLAVLKKK